MRITILDRAKQDFLDGFRFYEKQSEGAGRYFRDSLMADIQSLLIGSQICNTGRATNGKPGKQEFSAQHYPTLFT